MSGLTWLHISDWHQEGKIFNAKVVCDELVKDIRTRTKISPDLNRIDFIVFSGDVAQGGKAKQYDDAFKNFFKPILKAANLDPKFLFIVPGNHDQDRDAIHPDLPKAMKSNDEVDSWWDDDEKRSKILQPFQAFNDFKRKHLGQTPTEYADTRLWVIDGKKIALLGINSAWMCSRRKDQSKRFIDQGNLCVGEPQFYEALKQISEADIKIAVLHHPLDWLIPFDRRRVGNRLKRNCRFILHGHGHEPGASANTDTNGYHIVIPAGACYDRRKPPGSDYVFSYNTRDLMPVVYAEQLRNEHTRLERIGSQGVDLDVEASLNLSYRRLPQETARIFLLLSVFPSDFDAAAEEAICQDQGHAKLSNLVIWSLVEFEEETGRYHLHDLVRLFAARQQEEGKEVARSAALRLHAEYYIEVLSSATKLYQHGGKDLLTSLTKFDIERMNIAAGWGWTKDNFKDDNAAASLCNAYLNWPFLLGLRLHPKERVLWLETALAAARQLKNKGMEGANLGNLGVAYADLGDVRKAIEFYEKALNIEREIGDRRGEGQAMGNLGIAYTSLGDVRKAIEFYEKALNLDREICDQRAEGVVLGNLGNAYAFLGDAGKSIEFYEKRLAIAREIGDLRGEGNALWNMSLSLDTLGQRAKAIDSARCALKIDEQIESPYAERVRQQLAEWQK